MSNEFQAWVLVATLIISLVGAAISITLWRRGSIPAQLALLQKENDTKLESLRKEYDNRLTQFRAELEFLRTELKDTRLELAETRVRLRETQLALSKEQERTRKASGAMQWIRLALREMNIQLPPLPDEFRDEPEEGNISVNVRRDTYTSQIGEGARVDQNIVGRDSKQSQ